ncbi:hypothetical protein [Falsibacillus albus]|uniref:Uncharacterized protein n=1 Tax=Falsibacillus albus TaxID=2478915 RepID=A0A3L7JWR2_9BACI|nr:hypothetical protein [Falsibacillus albus]RLQ94755.1 hypothetical protein D9X91_12225 [Falsibacillus albus]
MMKKKRIVMEISPEVMEKFPIVMEKIGFVMELWLKVMESPHHSSRNPLPQLVPLDFFERNKGISSAFKENR